MVKISSIFVAFLENMNFILKSGYMMVTIKFKTQVNLALGQITVTNLTVSEP